MPSNFTPTPTYLTPIPIPVDGDRARESTFRPTFERFANNAAYLKAEQDAAPSVYRMRQMIESYLNPVKRWPSGVDAESLGGFVAANGVIYGELFNPADPRVLWTTDLVSWNPLTITGMSGQYLNLRLTDTKLVGFSKNSLGSLMVGQSNFTGGAPSFSWTTTVSLPSGNGVAFIEKFISSNRFLLITGPDKHLYRSDDLASWSDLGIAGIDPAMEVEALVSGTTGAGVDIWVLAPGFNANGQVYTANSPGLLWAAHTLPNCGQLYGLKYTGIAGMRFVGVGGPGAGGFDGAVWVSDDGATWTKVLSDLHGNAGPIIVTPSGVFVVDSAGYSVRCSRDGSHWGTLPPPRADVQDGTHQFDGYYVDAGNGLATLLMNGRDTTKACVYSGPRLAPMVLV